MDAQALRERALVLCLCTIFPLENKKRCRERLLGFTRTLAQVSFCRFYFLCRNLENFWTSTGMFPQELIISLQSVTDVSGVTVKCYNGSCFEFCEVLLSIGTNFFLAVALQNKTRHCIFYVQILAVTPAIFLVGNLLKKWVCGYVAVSVRKMRVEASGQHEPSDFEKIDSQGIYFFRSVENNIGE